MGGACARTERVSERLDCGADESSGGGARGAALAKGDQYPQAVERFAALDASRGATCASSGDERTRSNQSARARGREIERRRVVTNC